MYYELAHMGWGSKSNRLNKVVLMNTNLDCFDWKKRNITYYPLPSLYLEAWPLGYKTFFMLNTAKQVHT